jgi:hypothetical protein
MSVMTTTASKSNYFGVAATKLSEVKIRNMVQKYGPCAAFITVAPDDVNKPTSFRLSIRKLEDVNQSFPRETDEGFYEAMKAGSSEVASNKVQ